jgi:hypothetical protein
MVNLAEKVNIAERCICSSAHMLRMFEINFSCFVELIMQFQF